jgi:hypothetical protein
MAAAWFCGIPKGNAFFALFCAYAAGLAVVAHRDDRFLRDWAKFQFLPFSIRRFGPAAILNIATAVAFFAIAFAPAQCT